MTLIKFIKKNLAGWQDLFYGEGYTTQTRNGGEFRIDGVRGFWPVNSLAELAAIDPVKHPKVVLVMEGKAKFLQFNDGGYHPVSVESNVEVNDAFTSYVFKRSISTPLKPSATEGSYANPVPADWSDGVPPGSEPLWATTRVFSRTGLYPQTDSWTDVNRMADTASVDYEWSSVVANPGTPTTHPDNWQDVAEPTANWMAVRTITNGKPGEWQIVKIRGDNGVTGARGAGRYYADTLPHPYTWLANDAAANTAANKACPDGKPVNGDTVTLFKSGDRKVSVSKIFNGSVWEGFASVIPGHLLVEGTVVADTMRVGAVFGTDATFTGRVYAENIEGDIADFHAAVSTESSWGDNAVGERVVRQFTLQPADFARVLMIPPMAVAGRGDFSMYLRVSNGSPNPLNWDVVVNYGQNSFHGHPEHTRLSQPQTYNLSPSSNPQRLAITVARGRYSDQPVGDALFMQQYLTVSVAKAGGSITD